MRYAIVSDIHANIRAWEAVLADIRTQGVDVIVCLGDVVGYGPKPAEVLEAVRSVTDHFVLGNHDAAAVGMMDYSILTITPDKQSSGRSRNSHLTRNNSYLRFRSPLKQENCYSCTQKSQSQGVSTILTASR